MSFTVYRSSAGSGKTFTLVKEYLKIILVNPGDFRNVLAITFTNKAANEMKERVLKALEELSKADKSSDLMIRNTLVPLLIKETGLAEHEIALNAAQALEMILHNYSDFAIGTIDSFSHRLIRTFARDFGLPVNFNVELDADELLKTAVSLLLDMVGDDKSLTTLLVKFIETRMEDDKSWNIRSILTDFAKILLDEEGQGRIGGLKHLTLDDFNAIANDIYIRIRQFETRISEIAGEGTLLLKMNGISSGDLYQGEKGLGKYFSNLAAGKMDKLEPNSFVVTTLTEDKWFSGKVTAEARSAIQALKPQIEEIYLRLQDEIEQHRPGYSLRKLLSVTIYPLAVLNEIDRVLSDFKRQNNIVHISEFNARIAGIVMNEPVPFVYERLGDKFHHILIDEFQDTSLLQWLNFIPLIENSLAGGYFNLVVGDGKQAIYRWRGGEVEQFNSLPVIPGSDKNSVIKQREQSLKRHFSEVALEQNFRSKAEIVDFNNRFFRVVADQVLCNGKERIFRGLEQQYDAQNTGGYISLEFLQGDEEEPDYEVKTLSRIKEIILEAQQHNFNLRDMAVLCRSNYNASTIARFLIEQGIDVVSAESLLISNSASVRFLVAYLKFLFLPRNDIVIEEIRHFLLQTNTASESASADLRDEYMTLPVYDLCETLIRYYKLDPACDPHIRFFLDAVLKFTVKTSPGAVEFLEWWETNKAKLSIVTPEELDAIRVTTIHKAKGLEYPLVILPFAHESLENTKKYIWVELENDIAPGLTTAILKSSRDLESTVFSNLYEDEQQKSMLDMLNLLYVSMTRAEERLYILSKFPPKKQDNIRSLPGFFQLFLQNENIWADGESHYHFGSESDHIMRKARKDVNTVATGSVISTDWRQKIALRLRAPMVWDIDNPSGKSQWGNRVHTLLSRIITENDIAPVIERASIEGLIDHREVKAIEMVLVSVIGNPALAGLFSNKVKVKTEPEILLPKGTFYRPDRVVFDNETVTIVDYKTGKASPKHADQLLKYAGYIREMGYKHLKCLLVYLEGGVTVVEV